MPVLDPFQIVTDVEFPDDPGTGTGATGGNAYIVQVSNPTDPDNFVRVVRAFTDVTILESSKQGAGVEGLAFSADFGKAAHQDGEQALRGTLGNFAIARVNQAGPDDYYLVRVNDGGGIQDQTLYTTAISAPEIACADVIGIKILGQTAIRDADDLSTTITKYTPAPNSLTRLCRHSIGGIAHIHGNGDYWREADETWYTINGGPRRGDTTANIVVQTADYTIATNDVATTYTATLSGQNIAVSGNAGGTAATAQDLVDEANDQVAPSAFAAFTWQLVSSTCRGTATLFSAATVSSSATGGTGTMSDASSTVATTPGYVGPLLNGPGTVREANRRVNISSLTVAAGSPPPLVPANYRLTRITMNHAPLSWSGGLLSTTISEVIIRNAAENDVFTVPAGAVNEQLVALAGNTDGSGSYCWIKLSNEDFPRTDTRASSLNTSASDQPPVGLDKINIASTVRFGTYTPYQTEIRLYSADEVPD
jgi:hypothetical protein